MSVRKAIYKAIAATGIGAGAVAATPEGRRMAGGVLDRVRQYGEDVDAADIDRQALAEMAIGTGLAAYGARRVIRGKSPSTNKLLTHPAIVLGAGMNVHGFGRAVSEAAEKRKGKTKVRK